MTLAPIIKEVELVFTEVIARAGKCLMWSMVDWRLKISRNYIEDTHYLSWVKVHGSPCRHYWDGDLIGVDLSNLRENKYELSFEASIFVYPLTSIKSES